MHAYLRLSSSNFFLAARESFVALLPFILISSSVSLVQILLVAVYPSLIGSQVVGVLESFSLTLSYAFPMVMMVSLSVHFAKYLRLSVLGVMTLSLLVLLAVHVHVQPGNPFMDYAYQISNDPRVFILPVVAAYVLKGLSVRGPLNVGRKHGLNSYLALHLNLVLPIVIGFLVLLGVFLLIEQLFALIEWHLNNTMKELGPKSLLLGLNGLRLVFWSLGIHGDSAYMLFPSLVQNMQPVAEGIHVRNFIDLFASMGGSGASLSLLLAIFWQGRGHARRVAKIALPFSLFNLNEPLIYGLPVAFNPRLMLPFVLVPCINILLTYQALDWGWLSFNGQAFPWITPPLLNAWIASHSVTVVLFQLMLIILGVFVYLPFVRASVWEISVGEEQDGQGRKLQIEEDIGTQAEANYFQEQSTRLVDHKQVYRVIDRVLSGELLMYFQPKLAMASGQVVGFEALLRLQEPDGRISPPFFIDTLQRAGYALTLDRFVISAVADTLEQWAREGFTPRVAINLSPDSLTNKELMALLRRKLGPRAAQVEIEILESALIEDVGQVNQCLKSLQEKGFSFMLDDFGTGYSSLGLLTQLHINGVKLDRSMLTKACDGRGELLYRQICSLCLSQGLQLVAEGVETPEEEQFVRQAGVHYVQGWRYGKAMPADEARQFALLPGGYERFFS
ncbi:EAL domain-containing protein [Shewanella sp. GXUN23E]|uniref:EAL domain-containing protein n=1 Tax=Shewanella sp. GXUN23E TaxID=3422498 RepID=UPI003D7DC585